MRILALADEPPPAPVAQLVEDNRPDLLVTLGDLRPPWLSGVAALTLPRIGVHGNHDEPGQLAALGIIDLHLHAVERQGWTFSGFEGCVRYGQGGPHQYTQAQAAGLARALPPADVLLCHCPPRGVDDEPDDPAHVGFDALRDWVEENRPRYLLHGHTTPDPRTRVHQLGPTKVVWVRGALSVELTKGE